MRTGSTTDTRELLGRVQRLFEAPSPRGVPLRVGLEAEVIPVDARHGTPVPPRPPTGGSGQGTLPVLRSLARAQGWAEEPTRTGVPRFRIPHGGVLSFEPGGQLEYASPPLPSLDRLDDGLRRLFDTLSRAMEDQGIALLARGVDPRTPIEDACLVLEGQRYPRQRAHYDRIGPQGRVMMLQTAALHVNVDLGADPVQSWNAANALAPFLVAMFANSPERHGDGRPHRSHRAALWRVLDPARAGVFAPARDPAPGYLDFALDAGAFLLGDPCAPTRSFRDWAAEGATPEDFSTHLTTLFPEVRPRGYLELRSVDALPARWCVVPAAVACALIHHPPVRARLMDLLPVPHEGLLERAGRLGLADEELFGAAQGLPDLVMEGLHGLGGSFAGPGVVGRVEEFFQAFTHEGLDPAAAPASRMV